MRIGMANDHTAVEMKNEIKAYLESQGHTVINYGTDSSESTDYPDWGEKVANAVASGEVERGIAICGTGIGISLACNKVRGIRACACSEPYSAEYSRRHNNANIVCYGARVIGIEMAKMITDAFMNTEFEGGRHQRRVDKIMDIERRNCEK
ncbi:MAG: ribose 5-phosphate isomerase B [Solobacterium sp.]|nr:ribose 5-phosphate isomerase B [Solobacterium sp.]